MYARQPKSLLSLVSQTAIITLAIAKNCESKKDATKRGGKSQTVLVKELCAVIRTGRLDLPLQLLIFSLRLLLSFPLFLRAFLPWLALELQALAPPPSL